MRVLADLPFSQHFIKASRLSTEQNAKHYHAEGPNIESIGVILKFAEKNFWSNERVVQSDIAKFSLVITLFLLLLVSLLFLIVFKIQKDIRR